MKLGIASFCFAVLLIVVPAHCGFADPQPSLEQLRSALPQLNEMINSNPKNANALLARAYYYQQTGELQNAINDCTSAIAADPSGPGAYGIRLVAYMQLKDYANALKDADEVIRIKPEETAYSNRAGVYIGMRQYDKAAADYTKALQLNKSSATAYDGLAEISYQTRRYDRAITYANRALFLDPHMSEALYFRGKAYEALGKNALGKKDLEHAASAGYKPGELFIQSPKNPH